MALNGSRTPSAAKSVSQQGIAWLLDAKSSFSRLSNLVSMDNPSTRRHAVMKTLDGTAYQPGGYGLTM